MTCHAMPCTLPPADLLITGVSLSLVQYENELEKLRMEGLTEHAGLKRK